ncbi:hypothetical protein BV25DRAFT_1484481 [Artomyces pyxidatus]|uniref:Uncharacterized protein n=1 Tax=Artomyces pyxidatus TaxID=48021 RepID=A0ACB8TB38_9AGAM|nr:hypothetical protein BV25DRAFT_1484481 [Artomyces pyxidatus]
MTVPNHFHISLHHTSFILQSHTANHPIDPSTDAQVRVAISFSVSTPVFDIMLRCPRIALLLIIMTVYRPCPPPSFLLYDSSDLEPRGVRFLSRRCVAAVPILLHGAHRAQLAATIQPADRRDLRYLPRLRPSPSKLARRLRPSTTHTLSLAPPFQKAQWRWVFAQTLRRYVCPESIPRAHVPCICADVGRRRAP